MSFFQLKKSRRWIIIVISGGMLCGLAVGAFIGLTRDLPQIRSLESFKPSAVTRVFSSDHELLTEFFQEKRDPVPLEMIPSYLKMALLATEDRQFYQHVGVNLKAILRAVIKDILAGEFVEGASTITQQLAKTLFLTPRKTLVRKLREALLAFQLERRYTKDEILTFYLNQVYFGSGAYGVESAARIFFGKSVKVLNLAECALIAGMPKSPSRYSPLVNPDLAVKRRNIVLRQMADTGIITPAVYREASAELLPSMGRTSQTLKAPYFVEYIRKQLEEIVGPARLYQEGMTVLTTLFYRDQLAAETAIAEGLAAIEKRAGSDKPPNDDLQGALLSLDTAGGGIRAMVGGRDFNESHFNRAIDAVRQPGSAFKPFVYACAVERGFSQNRLILDAPVAFKGARADTDWQPENYSQTYDGEITLRSALVRSKNIPTVRLIEMIGPSTVARFSQECGISTPLTANLTLALGASGVSLIDLTAAYAVFPNRGEWIKPWGILEIQDSSGRVIWRPKPQKKVVMTRAGSAILTDMLVGVIQEGTGRRAAVLKRPLAGKTGTTDEYRDALFVGFSPSIACGVWVGNDHSYTLGDRESGARAALPIWMAYMQKVLASQPVDYFDIPDDIVRISIDPISGKPAAENAQGAVAAMFKKGTEPQMAP
ncbi:MAG: PBP1A family penicillin-binding protein [Desulfobacterales bacterium]|jgi:penicillin-binding protein 1A